jgi:hypothetical protein
MGWLVSVTPRPRFTPGERTPGTHCTGGWVGSRAGLDTEARGRILSPLSGIEPRLPGRSVRTHTLYWLSYPGSHCCVHTVINSKQECYIHIFKILWPNHYWSIVYFTFVSAISEIASLDILNNKSIFVSLKSDYQWNCNSDKALLPRVNCNVQKNIFEPFLH